MMENQNRLKEIKAVLLDLDGTLYLGPNLLPGALDFLRFLKEQGITRLFLTNNSFKSTAQYYERLLRLGLEPTLDEILTSGWATIHYLLSQTPYRSVFLLGSDGLRQEFRDAGIQVVLPDDGTACVQPDALVLGFDQAFTYPQLKAASEWLLRDIPYIASHPDKVCPTESYPIPDTGSLIEYFYAATGRRPVVIGKPNDPMIHAALSRTKTIPSETAMIGDRLYTDMLMARKNHLLSILVLSGETTPESLQTSDIVPDLVYSHVGELLHEFQALIT
jgi:HAD superfamily hydrolase (TIGR01450 family)